MFTKSFVSIYFLPDKILLLQLSANKKKVLKHGQIVLPEGLIKNYKIQDSASLSKILSSAWSKLHLKERIVGVVIPEFSTFTKYFKLPSLSVSEVDEAVKWQAQEYLPGGLENMILDWKITKKDELGTEVLTIAVDREVLSEYIEVVEKANLLPMKVETPSVCLLRYSKKENGGVLAIYKTTPETIIVLSEGEKIVGSSIQYMDNFDDILASASKMLKHYSDTEVGRVLLGGETAEQSLEKTSSVLKRKAELINPKIGGLAESEIQKYLIPLSMQYEDVDEPSDPTSLNLLPDDLVDKYKFEKLKTQAWSLTLTVTLFVWISFFVTLASYLFMTQSISDIKAGSVKENKYAVVANPLEEIESINTLSQKVVKIKKAFVLPQTLLNDIYAAKPAGIKIVKYELDLDKGEIRIQGVSADRTTLIGFKENLEKLENLDKVEIPISSFEAETNLEFSMTFLYKPIAGNIKEKPVKINPIK